MSSCLSRSLVVAVFSANMGSPATAKIPTRKNMVRKAGCWKERAVLFGYTDLYGGYAGGQAEYVRVLYANFGPRRIPSDLTDEEVLFLTDILPTGYTAIDWGQLTGGETVAVFGCGRVGLVAQKWLS